MSGADAHIQINLTCTDAPTKNFRGGPNLAELKSIDNLGATYFADRLDRIERAFAAANKRTKGKYTPLYMTVFCEPALGLLTPVAQRL